MAEYVSTFYYELEHVDGTDEADTRSAGFYVVFGFPEDGTSEGGGVETFSDEDVITYTVQPCGCEDPPEPLVFEVEYVGYFESGWVGLLNCGCEPDPIWVHVLITNDDILEFDQQIAVIEEPFGRGRFRQRAALDECASARGAEPHLAPPKLGDRTTRHPGYAASQRDRKLIAAIGRVVEFPHTSRMLKLLRQRRI